MGPAYNMRAWQKQQQQLVQFDGPAKHTQSKATSLLAHKRLLLSMAKNLLFELPWISTKKSAHTSQSVAVLNAKTSKLLEYCHLMKDPWYCDAWSVSLAYEFERLAQWLGDQESGTDTIFSSTNT